MPLHSSLPSVSHKRRRWLALIAVLALATVSFTPAALANHVALPDFQDDQGGANDEPGQKDLTGQIAASISGTFYSAWKWDDLAWSGKNTGDACSLFDTDGNTFADYAVCVTVGGSPALELSTRVYSCGDTRADRCTNPIVLLGTEAGDSTADWCTVELANAEFPTASNTQDLAAICNISQISTDLGIAAIGGSTLLNSCSYPSEQPNSDPSDCVVEIALTSVTVSTQSGGSIAWTATLTDTATLSPSGATGSVVFKLYSDSACTQLVWTSDADTTAPFNTAVGDGTPDNGNVITNLTVDADGIYYWIAEYTPTGLYTADSSACGEATTIVASVTGSAGS